MKRRTFKRLCTMCLAFVAAFTMGMSTASFAATPDTEDVMKVYNVEKGATVTAYQIVKEVKGEWKPVDGVDIKDTLHPTGNEIATINVDNLDPIELKQGPDGVYTNTDKEKLKAGMYLVMVYGTGATVYNPMIVSVDYDKVADSVDAKSNFSNDAYAKSSTPEVKKTNDTTGNTGVEANPTTNKGTSVQASGTANFTIETIIPSYSAYYDKPTFKVTDKMDPGLTPPEAKDVNVTVGGEAAPAGKYTVTNTKNADGFVVEFDSAYVRSLASKTNADRKVVIKYGAAVNDKATWNFVPNKNKATITYSKNNAANDEKSDSSKVYTFGLDATLNGTATTNNKKTHEIIKLDENGKAQNLGYTSEAGKEETVENALAGATFTLYSDESCADNTKVTEAKTTDNGYMEMKGLKEGTYYLKETDAPTGYAPLSDVWTVKISALYNDNGTLKSYTVNITDKDKNTYTTTYNATYKDGDSLDQVTVADNSETLFIKNNRMSGLPSTGGMGTYIFLIVGAAIMAFAAVAFVKNSKKANESK